MAQLDPLDKASVPWFGVSQMGRRVLDALFPPQCPGCSALVADGGGLCATCWQGVRFVTDPLCDACGLPFAYDPGPKALCGACVRTRPLYDRSRSALAYDDGSKGLAIRLKHADRTDTVPVLARWMSAAGADLIGAADVIVPVPLHWTRLFARRFNQSALLAQAIGRNVGKPVQMQVLVRTRRTRSQGQMGAAGRARNVKGAFRVAPRHAHVVTGRRVLLVDDVLTTGATVSACVVALKHAGAAEVDVLTLARVLPAEI